MVGAAIPAPQAAETPVMPGWARRALCLKDGAAPKHISKPPLWSSLCVLLFAAAAAAGALHALHHLGHVLDLDAIGNLEVVIGQLVDP